MKLIKKITAAVTAMAMAASMMSIGASAFSWHYSLSYDYTGGSTNVTNLQSTVTISSISQTVGISYFSRTNNSAYVDVKNPMHPDLHITATGGTPISVTRTISLGALGTKALMTAQLVYYSNGIVISSGDFTG